MSLLTELDPVCYASTINIPLLRSLEHKIGFCLTFTFCLSIDGIMPAQVAVNAFSYTKNARGKTIRQDTRAARRREMKSSGSMSAVFLSGRRERRLLMAHRKD